MTQVISAKLDAKPHRFALVVARFNEFITSRLVAGAIDELVRHGAEPENLTQVWVPGSWEIPLTAQKLAASGQYAAVICLGCVIRGQTPHFEYVASEVAKGVAQVSLTDGRAGDVRRHHVGLARAGRRSRRGQDREQGSGLRPGGTGNGELVGGLAAIARRYVAGAVADMPLKERSRARILALQALCAFDTLGESFADDLDDFLRDPASHADLGWKHAPKPELLDFARTLALGAWQGRDRYDDLLGKHVARWSLKRMQPVDRNLLRLGLFELLEQPETPYRVVLNEAVELARQFGGAESPGFVNGVLDGLRRELDVSLRAGPGR